MADSQPSSSLPTPSDGQEVFHEVSPAIKLVVRGVGIATTSMVILSFIFCIVKGSNDSNLYLLACNTLISAFVGIVNGWWYRQGDLSVEKYWFIVIVCIVIMFQCFTTDIFVFNTPVYNPPIPTTTIAPNVTTASG